MEINDVAMGNTTAGRSPLYGFHQSKDCTFDTFSRTRKSDSQTCNRFVQTRSVQLIPPFDSLEPNTQQEGRATSSVHRGWLKSVFKVREDSGEL